AAFEKLAKTSTTVLLPTNAGDTGSMVAQALTIFEQIRGQKGLAKEALTAAPWGKPTV
ncbi:MAG: band-7 C-terminal domain-containing protein, partial [Rickettsiales bacterium]